MNSIFAIKPYLWNGVWVFDDERVGLVKEALVAGADHMLDVALAQEGVSPDSGFTLLFSANPFPTASIRLDWIHGDQSNSEHTGNHYRWEIDDNVALEGWLCPALFLYFDKAPPNLYLEIREVTPNA